MLRFLENGHKIKIVETDYETYSVDIPADLDKARRVMKNDPLIDLY